MRDYKYVAKNKPLNLPKLTKDYIHIAKPKNLIQMLKNLIYLVQNKKEKEKVRVWNNNKEIKADLIK